MKTRPVASEESGWREGAGVRELAGAPVAEVAGEGPGEGPGAGPEAPELGPAEVPGAGEGPGAGVGVGALPEGDGVGALPEGVGVGTGAVLLPAGVGVGAAVGAVVVALPLALVAELLGAALVALAEALDTAVLAFAWVDTAVVVLTLDASELTFALETLVALALGVALAKTVRSWTEMDLESKILDLSNKEDIQALLYSPLKTKEEQLWGLVAMMSIYQRLLVLQ